MPTFFDLYRERTGDTRGDDDIAREFIRDTPELVARIPELRAKADEIRRDAESEFPITVGQRAKTAVGSGIRSFFGGIADIPEAIGVLNAESARKAGEADPYLGAIARGLAPLGAPEIMAPVGRAIRTAGEFLSPEPDPRLEESFLGTKVPGYIGSAASFMATGAAGRVLTGARAATGAALRAGATALGEDALAAAGENAAEAALKAAPNSLRLTAWVADNAPIAAAGALSQANGAYKEALSKGADRDTAALAGIANLPIGASEILPLGRMLSRLDGVTGGKATKFLLTSGKESFEEAAQEWAQQLAQNYVAQKLYDKDRNLLEDLQENAAGGGITGFLFSTLTQAIGHRIGVKALPSSGASTSSTELPPGVIPGSPPLAAGRPPAPAAPVAAPVESPAPVTPPVAAPAPVIARGMEELTGTPGPEDEAALRTWAKQDVEGTLSATERAGMENIFARNPRLSNAFALFREDAAKAAEIETAAKKTEPNPSDAQVEAENYKKGHVTLEGIGEVSIENAQGSVRRSKPGTPPWEVVMPNHYGQILGTKGADGDPLDITIGENPESKTVYVINQIDPKTGKFDETKSFWGFPSLEAAVASYDASFSDGSGPSRRRSVAPMAVEQFQDWVKNGDHKIEVPGVLIPKGGETNDQSNQQGLPGEVPLGAQPVQAQPQQGGGGEAAAAGGILQAQPQAEAVTPPAAPAPTPLTPEQLRAGIAEVNQFLAARGVALPAPISPPPAAPAAPQPVVAGVPAPSATRALPVAPVAVDPFSLVDEQTPFHSNLEGKPISEIEHLVTRNARVKEPVFDANGVRVLDSKGNPKQKSVNASTTTRMTFFEDTVTGKVFGVGTYENQQSSKGGVRVAYVGRVPGYSTGMPLRTLLEGGKTGPKGAAIVPAGRFKALDVVKTVPVKATDVAHQLHFANRADFEARMLGPVKTLNERNASYEGNVGVVEAGEATGAPAAVTAVETATPATAMEAQEGFTPDEAKAMYTATKAVRKGTLKQITDAIVAHPDAVHAARKMLDIIAPKVDNDADDAAQMLLEWIHDAHTLSKGKEKAFTDALTKTVAEERAANLSGRGSSTAATAGAGLPIQGGQATSSGVGPAGAVNPAGTEPGPVGGGGQGTAAGAAGQADKVTPEKQLVELTDEERNKAEKEVKGDNFQWTPFAEEFDEKFGSVRTHNYLTSEVLELLEEHPEFVQKTKSELRDKPITDGDIARILTILDYGESGRVPLGADDKAAYEELIGLNPELPVLSRTDRMDLQEKRTAFALVKLHELGIDERTETLLADWQEIRQQVWEHEPGLADWIETFALGGVHQPGKFGPLYGEGTQERRHSAPASLPPVSSPAKLSQTYKSTLAAAAQQGLNVTLVQQGVDGIASEISGVYGREAGHRMAVVGVNDVNDPSMESLYVLTAEVAHDVFASLSPADQARLQSAVKVVTDAALGISGENISISESVPESEQGAVLQEERLVDATTRALVSEGFNPAEAQGFAQALWRAIKDLVLRAARVLHGAWIGATGQESGAAGASLAQSYFENRVRSWLAGDARALSMTDFMGGGSTQLLPMVVRRATWHTPAYGEGMAYRWNPELFTLEAAEASMDSVSGIRANFEMATIRYHRNGVAPISPDQGPEIRIPDFAAANEIDDILTSQFAEFNAQGHNVTATGQPAMTQAQFNEYVLPGTTNSPTENKAAMTAEMQRVLGATVPNPDVRLVDLNPATKVETSNKAIVQLNKIRSSWERRDNEASNALSNDPSSTQSRADKNALRVVNLTNNYTDAEFLFSEMKENVTGWLRWLRDGLRQGFTEGRAGGRQIGVLEQVIKGIEGRIDKPIATQYASALDAVVKKYTADPEHRTRFVVMMQKIAELPVWFGESDAQTVKDFIAGTTDPDLAAIRQDTPEGRALLTIATAFARSNALAMHMLALRGAGKTDELLAERTKLNEIIKSALSDNREAFKNARRDASKLSKLRSRADAILDELEKAKEQQRVLHDELMSARRWTEFYRTNAPLLDQQIASFEEIIGAERTQFEATEGSPFSAPENPTQAPKDWKEQTFHHTRERGGTQEQALISAQQRLQAWIDAHPVGSPLHGGADYNYAQATLEKLRENGIDGQSNEHVRRVTQAVFGPMTVKLEQTGVPALKSAARRLRQFLSLREQFHRPSDAKAVTFSVAEDRARAAMGYRRRQLQNFRKLMNQAWFYLSQRKDLLYGAPSDQAGKDARVNATLDFLHLTGKKRAVMNAFIREWGDQSEHYVRLYHDKMGGKVEDDALGMTRDPRGAWGEVMRMMSGEVNVVATEMNGAAGHSGAWSVDPFKDRNVAEEYAADPNDLRQSMAPLFSPPNVWRNFVAPIANRPGSSMFNGPEDSSGFSAPARVEDVKKAFDATAEGDIVGFAENLFTILGGTGDRGAFVAQTISVFSDTFKEIKAQMQESSMGTRNNIENVTQLLMNARRGENWPPEFITYRPYDLRNTRSLVNHLAFHSAFGRNMVSIDGDFTKGISDLRTMHNSLAKFTDEALRENPTATPSQLRAAVEKKANDASLKLSELQKASASLAMVEQEQKNLRTFINSQGGVALEFRAFTEMISAGVAAVVQGPATHLLDTISLFKPIQLYGVSIPGLKFTARNITGYLGSRRGSLMELFGKTVEDEAGHFRRAYDMGVQDTSAQHTFKDRALSVIMNASVPESAPLHQRIASYFSIAGRLGREIISTGIPGLKNPAGKIYPRIKPVGTFTSGTQHMLMGATKATWETFEEMTGRAVQWLENPAHAADRNDPAFRFVPNDADQLGYSNKFLGLLRDKKAFAAMLNTLNQHGLTLEGLAKDYMQRRAVDPAAPIFTDHAFAALLPIAPTEILQESSLGSRPSAMITNPILHNGLPLVGWAIAQTGSVASSFYPKLGAGDWKDFLHGLWAFAAMMGIGMAYGLMRDLYDEDLLGKKANRLTLGRDNTALALIDRADQVGSVGILGSAVNSIANRSTARDFSIDSRVFAVSMTMNLMKAVSDWYHQGGTATYATVGRPILQSLGGSGYMQYAQILNHITGAGADGQHLPGFEQEARMTARINAANWLRVAGRGLDMEVRTPRGSSDAVPNQVTPWVREMGLAAYGNDPIEFNDARQKAIAAARDEKKPDPIDFVKRAYESQHPLRSIFKTQLSEADVRRLLAALPDDGRQDVMQAVRLFNRYGERLGIADYWGKAAAATGGAATRTPLRSVTDVLRSQARLPAVAGF